MKYWLFKSEPDVFGIDDLAAMPGQTEHWDGIRNYQARNMLRDEVRPGDQVFFYHSNCPQPAIVGIMEVVRDGYPDHTAFDPDAHYFDPKSNPDEPRWFMVDVRFVRHLARPVSLQELKTVAGLEEMPLLRRGNRLSIMPVSAEQWTIVLNLEHQKPGD